MQTQINRRQFIAAAAAAASVSALCTAAPALAAGTGKRAAVGLAAFSSHHHWKAARERSAGIKFSDALGFFNHARSLGLAGVQAPLRGKDDAFARELRGHVEKHQGYYESDVLLPGVAGDWEAFEVEVRLARTAGAEVARAVLLGGRRYEVFKSMAEFRAYRSDCVRRLQRAEPIVRKHRLKLAIENHKDLTSSELIALLRDLSSEWVGVCVDTGNNLALLEDPQSTAAALAPLAMTVHLKDMAVQPHEAGFRLSEVIFGTGLLDLKKVIAVLQSANAGIAFNIEMATREPLVVPCRTDRYWATFPGRDEAALAAALARVEKHPPKAAPPTVAGLSLEARLSAEEQNNRKCVAALPAALSSESGQRR